MRVRTPTIHRTETKKAEADQAEGGSGYRDCKEREDFLRVAPPAHKTIPASNIAKLLGSGTPIVPE